MVSLNRIAMQKSSRRMIEQLGPENLEVAEISGKWGRRFGFKSYEQFRFPYHDICAGPYLDAKGEPRQFDLILANQVWEHLDRPYSATCNVLEMLRPGAYFWIAVPFFVPFHGAPNDCSRWSARGLKNLLMECGFAEEAITVEQWGNRAAALRNMEPGWPPEYREGDDLENDPDMPICCWALAQNIE